MTRIASKTTLAILAGSVSLLTLLHTAALATPVNLGAAGPQNFNVLEIGTGNLNIAINAGGPTNGVQGNVGLNGTGTLSLTGTTFVGGNVIVANNVNQVTTSGGGTVMGNVIVNAALLAQARTDALNAAAVAAALPSSGVSYGTMAAPINITSGGITLHAGVYYINKFELGNGDYIHLANDGTYVFNIIGDLKINGPAENILDGGLSANDVLFNYLGSTAIAFSGGSNPDGSEKAVLNGIILAPNAQVNLAPGQVTGEIISGQNISIVSGSDINQPITPVPEPTTALFGAALLGVMGFGRRRTAAPVVDAALS